MASRLRRQGQARVRRRSQLVTRHHNIHLKSGEKLLNRNGQMAKRYNVWNVHSTHLRTTTLITADFAGVNLGGNAARLAKWGEGATLSKLDPLAKMH